MTLRSYMMIGVLGCVFAARGQEKPMDPPFCSPFDFPLSLSGNFGELRSNHFHGGVDFKTQGVVGKPIRCIADGYVSRVLVTPGGYGQALYVTHPNGYTSVYGHVLKFASAVSEVVEEYQYEHETFAVDLNFEPGRFPFKAGEVIALSGNEGYSFGPHLHMEIRRTDTGELIDPLQFYTGRIKDTTPPRASMVVLYPQQGAGVVDGLQEKKFIPVASLGQPVSAWGEIAAGIKAYDYMDGTHNNYGVRSVVLYVDTAEVFRSTVDGVLPEENRMINAWTDYEAHVKKGDWVMRSHILPGNRLRMLQTDGKKGVITIDEERDYHLRYELSDLYGNTSTYSFVVRGRRQPIEAYAPSTRHYLVWNKGNVVQEPGLELVIPRGMLYEDVALNCCVVKDTAAVSYEYQLHDAPVALHDGCTLMIGVRHLPVADTSKYYVARKWNGKKASAGGVYENGWMKASIRELGTYTVALDTLPPRVVPLNKAQWKTGNIQFKISDAETGIKEYKVKIDGAFALFGFSSKNAKLWMKHPERLKKGVPHTLELVVTDYCGNETREEYVF
ncbi:M23 family metallopeptidase [Phocaeicola sp.]|uniref:M23 family metallopeptidase n=1 Tax=Phocaeicola sp. TaxID=2773926 RepID=UPI0023D6466E|nr:M23 family metallopeptidase [Phocaeicola sp.]MDE5676691.1 M23 family metallopeptidase [Phocaeicola sp.]